MFRFALYISLAFKTSPRTLTVPTCTNMYCTNMLTALAVSMLVSTHNPVTFQHNITTLYVLLSYYIFVYYLTLWYVHVVLKCNAIVCMHKPDSWIWKINIKIVNWFISFNLVGKSLTKTVIYSGGLRWREEIRGKNLFYLLKDMY